MAEGQLLLPIMHHLIDYASNHAYLRHSLRWRFNEPWCINQLILVGVFKARDNLRSVYKLAYMPLHQEPMKKTYVAPAVH